MRVDHGRKYATQAVLTVEPLDDESLGFAQRALAHETWHQMLEQATALIGEFDTLDTQFRYQQIDCLGALWRASRSE